MKLYKPEDTLTKVIDERDDLQTRMDHAQEQIRLADERVFAFQSERDAALVDAKRWRYARAGGTTHEVHKAMSPEEMDAYVDANIARITKETT